MMRILLVALAATLPLTALPALAKSNGHCPPGLAKKAVPCVPPGQAKKGAGHDGFRRGDTYVDRYGYVRVRNPDRYRLPRLRPGESYYRNGTLVYRVDRETREILEFIRLADRVFGN